MKAQCVVAHPDDCVIFARPFIENYFQFEWTVVYLTYNSLAPRAIEVSEYWKKHNVSTVFLGVEDSWEDVKQGQLGFDSTEVGLRLLESINCDLLLTHNVDGEYGHPHHMFIHQTLKELPVPQIYFASDFNYNFKCRATTFLDLEQLPLHKDVIASFNLIDQGLYYITESAMPLIKQ